MPHPKTTQHHRTAFCAAALAGLLALGACSSYELRLPDSQPWQPEGQAEEYESRIMHTYFWGLINKPRTFDAQCKGEAINDVIVESNYAMDLATVLTFGIWSPIEIKYRCHAPSGEQGEFPSESDSSTSND